MLRCAGVWGLERVSRQTDEVGSHFAGLGKEREKRDWGREGERDCWSDREMRRRGRNQGVRWNRRGAGEEMWTRWCSA